MSYGLAWLQSQTASRCILVEVVANILGSDTTLYMSSTGYITESGDTPSSTNYVSIISGGVNVSENISLDGTASLSYGDIEISNIGGIRDNWLDYIWENRSIKVFIGDKSWARAEFQMIFNGLIEDIEPKSRDTLNLKIRDKLQQLNCPVSDTKLGGSTSNKDAVLPLVFGEVCNITPLLINPTTLEYMVHDGPIEGIIEVRDNGVPITSYTVSLSTGRFTLTVAAAGTITCSVQGSKPSAYTNRLAEIIQNLVLNYGKVSTRFVSGDLDASNLSTFNTAHTQPMGIYLSNRENLLSTVQDLASSIQAQIVSSRLGLMRILQIDFPPGGTPAIITQSDIIFGSLKPVSRPKVQAAVKLGYCKNWTPQDNLQTGIQQSSKDLLAKDFLTVTRNNSTVATSHKLDTEPVQRDTYLLVESDASAEADRELNIYSTPRAVYSFEGLATSMLLELGQALTLINPRFGFSTGKTGVVIGLNPDWITLRVIVEVMF